MGKGYEPKAEIMHHYTGKPTRVHAWPKHHIWVETTVEKHGEDQKYINLVLVNPNRAHDRIPRKEVWRCAREQQVPEKYIIVFGRNNEMGG